MNKVHIQLNKLVQKQLHEFPFHNLALLLNKPIQIGGTCFDHALRIKSQLKSLGFNACLHEVFVCMTGELCHRIVKVDVNEECYFLDTGSGLPTNYIIRVELGVPALEHCISGIPFKIITNADHILIKRYNGKTWLDMNKIPLAPQDESKILSKFSERYSQKLPFKNELRISWLNGQRFFRVEGLQLSVFETNTAPLIQLLKKTELKHIIATNFPELTTELEQYLRSIH